MGLNLSGFLTDLIGIQHRSLTLLVCIFMKHFLWRRLILSIIDSISSYFLACLKMKVVCDSLISASLGLEILYSLGS